MCSSMLSNKKTERPLPNVSSTPPWCRSKKINDDHIIAEAEPVIPPQLLLRDEAKAMKYLEDAVTTVARAKQIYVVNRRTTDFDECLVNLLQVKDNLKTLPVHLNPKISAKVSQFTSRISRYVHALQSLENHQYSMSWRKMLKLLERSKLPSVGELEGDRVDTGISAEKIECTSFEYNSPISCGVTDKPSCNNSDRTIERPPLKKPNEDPDLKDLIELVRSKMREKDPRNDRRLGLPPEKPDIDPSYEAADSTGLKNSCNDPRSHFVAKIVPVKSPNDRFTTNSPVKPTLSKEKPDNDPSYEATDSTRLKNSCNDPRSHFVPKMVPVESPNDRFTTNSPVKPTLPKEKPDNDPSYEAADSTQLKNFGNDPRSHFVPKMVPVKSPNDRFTMNSPVKPTLPKKSKNCGPISEESHGNTEMKDPKKSDRCWRKMKRSHSSIRRNSSPMRNSESLPKRSSWRSVSSSSTRYKIIESQSKCMRSSKWQNSPLSDSDREYKRERVSYFSKKIRKNSTFDSNEGIRKRKRVRYSRDRLVNPLVPPEDLDPVDDGDIFAQFLKMIPFPAENCIFCAQGHHSHLCTKVNTLESRLAFFDRKALCFKCSLPRHRKKCQSLEKFCKWQHCLAVGEHHSAICPKINYPITHVAVERYFAYISAMRRKYGRKLV